MAGTKDNYNDNDKDKDEHNDDNMIWMILGTYIRFLQFATGGKWLNLNQIYDKVIP